MSKRVMACAALTMLALGAVAQTPERLARPVAPSAMGSDGRMHVSPGATMGNLLVDQYAAFGRRLSAPDVDRAAMTSALRPMMCNMNGAGGFIADRLRPMISAMSRDERAQVRARDEARLTGLAVALAASFDDAEASAVTADEALGPGVYHDAIGGFATALDACHFFGLEQRL